MDEMTGRVFDGKYRLVRLLGKGGMGAVFEAEHVKITRKVAVKVLRSRLGDSPEAAQRFLREAQSASAIGHPNIIDIYDIGEEEDGTLFMVMEYLRGESLGAYTRRQGRVAAGQTLTMILQVLSALAAAHAKGIVHRDLKPDNLFLVKDDGGRLKVKVLDFGISKVTAADEDDPGLTRTGTVMGTPVYMSPEQARGAKTIDGRTDIWAAGVILYQMLSGELPYRGDSYNEILSKILIEPIPPLADHIPGLPERLNKVVHRALEKDLERRYGDAGAFALDLLALKDIYPELTGSSWDHDPLDVTLTPDEGVEATMGGPRDGEGFGTDETVASEEHVPEPETSDAPTSAPAAPIPPSRKEAPQTVLPRPPLWKRALWYGLTLPPAWSLMLVPPDYMQRGGGTIFGLRETAPVWMSYLLFGAIAAGMTFASIQIERFWSRRTWNRWLQGPGFIVFPILGLLATLRCHSVLDAQVRSALTSFRSYAAIGEKQAQGVLALLWGALAQYLNTVSVVMVLLSVLTLIVLLGYVFATPSGAPERSSKNRLRWLTLPGGILVILAAELLVFPGSLKEFGLPWRLILYLVWCLTAVTIIRERAPEGRSYSLGWRALFSGTVAIMAVASLSGTVGLIGLYGALESVPVDQRADFASEAGCLIGNGLEAMQHVLAAALLVVIIGNRKWLGWVPRGEGRAAVKRVAMALLTLIATILPYGTLVMDNISTGDSIQIPMGAPAIVEMTPASMERGGEASFYIDRAPSSLSRSRPRFFARLTGEDKKDFTPGGLLAALAGSGACGEALSGTVGPAELPEDWERRPARCVTGIEARLFCEARGKRLPTPAEWRAALGSPAPGERGGSAGQLQRGGLAEWTMKEVHGTATFEVMGATAEMEVEGKLGPASFSPHVGFRCAFTFDE